MSLYTDPRLAIINSINQLNKLNMVLEQYNFGTPVPSDTFGPNANTAVQISAKDVNSAYAGSVTVGYYRQPLSSLEAQVNSLVVPVNGHTTTMDIANALNKIYGTMFTSADIVDRPLAPEEMEYPGLVMLEAAAGSYGWIGTVEVETREGGYVLPSYVSTPNLPGLNYPAPTTTRPYAHIYSYWRDFSGQYDNLSLVEVGTGQLDLVRTALAAVTGDTWLLTGSGRYSLDGAQVLAAGETAGVEGVNQDFQFYITVSLNEAMAVGLAGNLTLHFNAPAPE